MLIGLKVKQSARQEQLLIRLFLSKINENYSRNELYGFSSARDDYCGAENSGVMSFFKRLRRFHQESLISPTGAWPPGR